jgi:hypothetical protein
MATAGIVVCSPYGITCTDCNEASDCSESIGARQQPRSTSFLVLRELRSRDRVERQFEDRRRAGIKQEPQTETRRSPLRHHWYLVPGGGAFLGRRA